MSTVTTEKSKVLEQTKCPVCPSSDAFFIYEKVSGVLDAHCYSCGYHRDPFTYGHYNGLVDKTEPSGLNRASKTIHKSILPTLDECLSHPIRPIPERSLSRETCERFQVRIGVDTKDGSTPIYYLFPRTKNGDITGFMKKDLPKNFIGIGDCKDCEPFGFSLLPERGKRLFITEGAEDAMSVYQCLKDNSNVDWEPDVIALLGANKISHLAEYAERINKFDKIILCLDNDAVGKEATNKICKMFSGKVYTVKLTEKDPNDMLMKGKGVDLKWALLTGAKKYQPDGIVNAKDCWERYKKVMDAECFPYPSTMPILNQKTYGVRPGSLVTITSGSGCGKTQFLRELKYHYWLTTNEKIADIALEEDVGDTIGGLMSLHLNKRITLPDVNVPEEQEKQAFQDIFDSGRFTMYDYFGGMDDDNLFSKLRYFTSTGHKFIFLDHLSIVVSEYASEGGERERIDTIMTKLAKLVKETNCVIFLVVHLKKAESSSNTFEQGATPSLDDLRGSGSIKQLSWDVIGLSRNQQHPDKLCANTSELHVLKCRFTGRTGKAGFLLFDDKTGRMIQSEEPSGYRNVR